MKKINSALISVYYKDGLDKIVKALDNNGVTIYSTGGTQTFIESLGVKAHAVEDLTSYPSILGGRVKTLHPKVFGGILAKRNDATHNEHLQKYEIPQIDLVIVDLYPFEQTVESGAPEADIIEKIDIGGISLIRAAAKNYNDVAIVPSVDQYEYLLGLLENQNCQTNLEQRRYLAAQAFNTSSHYDTAIFNFFNEKENIPTLKQSFNNVTPLRYGENPHQEASFVGNMQDCFDKLHGKDISYNNLLDIDAALALIGEFEEPTFAVLKHNNACGVASRDNICDAWVDALEADPVSAFGGVLVANRDIDAQTAAKINEIFFEVILAPNFSDEAMAILQTKKNRIILKTKPFKRNPKTVRSVLGGIAVQQMDDKVGGIDSQLKNATKKEASKEQLEDLLFANKIVKHSKSNAIVLAKNKQLVASGIGQTSRVDALMQAIAKAKTFEFELKGTVMASDAFFPFADCIEIANNEGINAVIQPGGSMRDGDTVQFCDKNNIAMVMTGMRHFKH